MARLLKLALPTQVSVPADSTNRFADDPNAAALGKKLFFDSRFSGPLLDEANTGQASTLGMVGDTGRVACAGCHVPANGRFDDNRTARGQLSLGAGWTHRRTPQLLDVGQASLLAWDGRRTTSYSVVFAVIESPLEFNSSRLFVAQQIAALYKSEYEAIFGPLPALDQFPVLAAADAGCTKLPSDPTTQGCPKPGADDEAVTRVVANMGKAISAYNRLLTCGESRFDKWIRGDAAALTPEEQAGARLFVGKAACDGCHSGPYFTDQKFHNVGAQGSLVPFTGVDTRNDPGAATGLAHAHDDWLGPQGPFSDGDDGRLDQIPQDLSKLEGAFRTPGLRCMENRKSFMHNGEYRSLENVMELLDAGQGHSGFVGTPETAPLGLTVEEKAQLVAFMLSLQGPGPDQSLRDPPTLP